MVRKNELNCRNTWDQDLWEPQLPVAQRAPIVADHDIATVSSEFVPPAGATDRVTSIGVEMVKPYLPPAGIQGGRYFPRVDADDESVDVDSLAWLTPESVDDDAVDAEPLGALRRDGSAATDTAQRGGLRPLLDLPQEFQSEPVVVAARMEPVGGLVPVAKTDLERSTPVGGTSTIGASAIEQPVAMPRKRGKAQAQQPTEPLPELQALPSSTDSPQVAGAPRPFAPGDGSIVLNQRSLTFDARLKPASRINPALDRVSKLADLQRCCGTCRDFKRHADGTSGVCTNAYAFPDGAVVKSDVLACSSSMGVWWLPNDDLFVNAVDTSHHSRPTPYLDAALGQRAGSEAGRDSRAW
jgi:hypothetical protein